MSLPNNELRSRAAAFARDWEKAHYEKGETQSFWNAFFQIFDIDRKRVATYEHSVEKLKGGKGFIDLFYPGTLIIEQKSLGRDLLGARLQAMDYTHSLSDAEMPRYILACDFRTWEMTDLETGEQTAFTLADLPRHIDRFRFLLGRNTRVFKDQDPVNIRAAELVGALHDALEASGYTGHKLEVFLTRIVFCLFADDTGIFEPKDILAEWLHDIADAASIGPKIGRLFEVLNTSETARQKTLPADLARFPYINGHLFETQFPSPDFNEDMRTALLNACRFDWTPISPAIFGSLFQSVMDKAERRRKGAHYTTERNILKLIGPLFLDDLRDEFAAIKSRRTGRQQALRRFHDKLASLTFFDPACGCGNFLVITYRELRALELEVLKEIHADLLPRLKSGVTELPVSVLSRVDVDQFFGIEIEEFPARIAETALWMMDHLMNLRLSEEFGKYYPRIPLKKAPTIRHGDALELDWATVLPPQRCSYVLGNPPFIGHQNRNAAQVRGMHRVWGTSGQFNRLDFVTCWFKKAADYALAAASPPTQPPPRGGRGTLAPLIAEPPGADPSPPSPPVGEGRGGGAPGQTPPRIAFVSTNSICQGEQAGILWPTLFRLGFHITFGHRTFQWNSEARGKAAVHCVIVGLSDTQPPQCRVFEYDTPKSEPAESIVPRLNGYLVNGPQWALPARTKPRAEQKRVIQGSKPADGARLRLPEGGYQTFSNLILEDRDRDRLIRLYPPLSPFIRPFVGGDELISGDWRWCLWLKDASPKDYDFPDIRDRLRRVREGRLQSPTESVRGYADYPTLFTQDRQPDRDYIAIPEVSSETRDYIPIALLSQDVIASNKLMIMPGGTLTDFAVLTSRMHMAWMRTVAGRLKSDYSYSPSVWFTFPLPPAKDLSGLDPLAQAILDARAAHPGATLATLYDPDLMPANLRKAHADLDRAVDRLYRASGFASDRERVEHLFALYEAMVAPLLARPKQGRGRKSVPKS